MKENLYGGSLKSSFHYFISEIVSLIKMSADQVDKVVVSEGVMTACWTHAFVTEKEEMMLVTVTVLHSALYCDQGAAGGQCGRGGEGAHHKSHKADQTADEGEGPVRDRPAGPGGRLRVCGVPSWQTQGSR